MIFTPKHILAIIAGTKTQTRRVVKPGEELVNDWATADGYTTAVLSAADRRKWRVGQDYAVQPGRGKPGVWWHPEEGNGAYTAHILRTDADRAYGWRPLRIRILELRREPVQTISEEDAIAEGCAEPVYDPRIGKPSYRMAYYNVWREINTRKGTRWNENPDAWAITYEVVK